MPAETVFHCDPTFDSAQDAFLGQRAAGSRRSGGAASTRIMTCLVGNPYDYNIYKPLFTTPIGSLGLVYLPT